MSEPLRIALVAEGPTDRVVIESAISVVLGQRAFVLKLLQPEDSLAFGPLCPGWAGVHRWCRQAVARAGGPLRQDILFQTFDLLILHLDADVADKRYSDGSIRDYAHEDDLPCSSKCPPPQDTVDALRKVLLRWAGESSTPPRTVLCIPSKSMEAWVVTALFPDDRAARSGIECLGDPEARLGQQPKATRIRKSVRNYNAKTAAISKAWPSLIEKLTQAARFNDEFYAAAKALPSSGTI